MVRIEDYAYPAGLRLLGRWQAGEREAGQELARLLEAAIAGDFDDNFAVPAPRDRVHATASVHMLTLALLFDLLGIEARDYYTSDPYRYVRANLAVSRLLGMDKFYMTWALYAFTCEPLGQAMMYPDRFPPGADPDQPLIGPQDWHTLGPPDFTTGIVRAIDGIMSACEDLTGLPPLLQISAPYSLAADIYGQERLLADVVNDPGHVNALLDHIGDAVLGPWMDHHFATFPNGWVELSDASGSPFFIGPEACMNLSIRAIRHMLRDKPYADRVYDNNYRGDFVARAPAKARTSRRRRQDGGPTGNGDGLLALTEAKVGVNPVFIMRLQADKVDISFYEDQAIRRNMPLTSGVGSPEIDRNSIEDMDAAKRRMAAQAGAHVAAIRRVCEAIDLPPDNHVGAPWPSHIYFEDINGQSAFELVETVLDAVRAAPPFERPA